MSNSFRSFFYDYAYLKDTLKEKEKFDILYELGYTSVVPSYIWFNVKKLKTPVLITNMDDLNGFLKCFDDGSRIRFVSFFQVARDVVHPFTVGDWDHDVFIHRSLTLEHLFDHQIDHLRQLTLAASLTF